MKNRIVMLTVPIFGLIIILVGSLLKINSPVGANTSLIFLFLGSVILLTGIIFLVINSLKKSEV